MPTLAALDQLSAKQRELLSLHDLSVDLGEGDLTLLHTTWLPAARVVSLCDAEQYCSESPTGIVTPRNEAAACALLLERELEPSAARAAVIDYCCSRTTPPSSPGVLCEDAVSLAAEDWARRRGIVSGFRAATFNGSLRGASCTSKLQPGDVFAELPLSSLVTAATARECPVLSPVLAGLPDDVALIIWTLRERSLGVESRFAPLLDSLPSSPLGTGLTLSDAAQQCIEGTLLGEEARILRVSAEEQYASLFPALLDTHPAVFSRRECFTFERYVCAVELWQAYAIQLQISPDEPPITALAPMALLLNHSTTAPHCVRFSRLDPDGVLRLRTVQSCAAGEQLFLSYGALGCNKQLLFYGFAEPCVYDEVPLAFDPPDVADDEAASMKRDLLTRWGLGLEHSLREACIPSALLGALRILTSQPEDLAQELDPRAGLLSRENEEYVLAALMGTLDALTVPPPFPASSNGGDVAVCLAYLESQQRILREAKSRSEALLSALKCV